MGFGFGTVRRTESASWAVRCLSVLALLVAGGVLSAERETTGALASPTSPDGSAIATTPLRRTPVAAAIDAVTGHLFIASTDLVHGQSSSPSIASGTVTMLSTATDAVLSTTSVGPDPLRLVVAARANRVFALTRGMDPVGRGAGVTMLNATTGAVVRTLALPALPTDMAVDEQTNHLFVAIPAASTLERGGVLTLDAATGTTVISTTVGYNPTTLVVDGRTGRVFVGNAGGRSASSDPYASCLVDECDPAISLLDARSGSLQATTILHQPPRTPANTLQPGCGPALYASADRVLVVVGSGNRGPGALRELDGTTGAIRSVAPFDFPSCSMEIDAVAHHALLRNAQAIDNPYGTSTVTLLDTSSGIGLRQVATGPRPGPIAIDAASGYAFVGSSGGAGGAGADLRAIRMETGAVVRVLSTGMVTVAVAIDPRTHHLFAITRLPTTGGSSAMFPASVETATGSAAVGHDPSGLAVDNRSGHAFVLDRGNSLPVSTTTPWYLSTLDAATGAIVRSVAVGLNASYLAVDGRAGHVFVGSESSATTQAAGTGAARIAMLDTHTGLLQATSAIPAGLQALVDSETTGRVFAFISGSARSTLVVIDAATDRIVGTTSVSGTIYPGAVDGRAGLVYTIHSGCFRTCRNGIAVFDARNGALNRTIPVDGDLTGIELGGSHGQLLVSQSMQSMPAGSGTRPGTRLLVLDATRGGILHSTEFPRPIFLLGSDQTNRQVVGSDSLSPGSTPAGPVRLYVLDSTTGSLLRTVQLRSAAQVLALDIPSHHVFATNAAGGVSMYDDSVGSLLATAAVGVDPQLAAIMTLGNASTRLLVVVCLQSDSVSLLSVISGAPRPINSLSSRPREGAPAVGSVPSTAEHAAPLYAYGDSYTVGYGASTASAAWPARLATLLGRSVIPIAKSNVQLESWAGRVYDRPRTKADTTLILLGLNDMRYFGTSSKGQATVHDAMLAALLWSAIPSSAILSSRSLAYTGNWTYVELHEAMSSDQKGAVLRGAIQGTSLYIAYYQQVAPAGTFSVIVDGRMVGTYSCHALAGPSSTTSVAAGIWPAAIRIAGLLPRMHDIEVIARGDGRVTLDWVSGNQIHGPTVILGTLPTLAPRSYQLSPPLDHGSDAAVALFNQTYVQLISQLRSDGLDARAAPVSERFHEPEDLAPDLIHPNNQGHQHIAEAFLEVLHASP